MQGTLSSEGTDTVADASNSWISLLPAFVLLGTLGWIWRWRKGLCKHGPLLPWPAALPARDRQSSLKSAYSPLSPPRGSLKPAPRLRSLMADSDEEEDEADQGTEHQPIMHYGYDDDDDRHHHSMVAGRRAPRNSDHMQRNHNISDNLSTTLSDLTDESPGECAIGAPGRSLEPLVWDDGEVSRPLPSSPVRNIRPVVRWDDDDEGALPISRQAAIVSARDDQACETELEPRIGRPQPDTRKSNLTSSNPVLVAVEQWDEEIKTMPSSTLAPASRVLHLEQREPHSPTDRLPQDRPPVGQPLSTPGHDDLDDLAARIEFKRAMRSVITESTSSTRPSYSMEQPSHHVPERRTTRSPEAKSPLPRAVALIVNDMD